jgi:GntR family transcriptional regulator
MTSHVNIGCGEFSPKNAGRTQGQGGKPDLKTRGAEDLLVATQGAVDRGDPRPLHKQVYEALLAAINDGRLPLRGKLPSERELVDLYAVSRITVRHAIRELIQQGVVHSQPGKGLYVTERGGSFELQVLKSFTSIALANGRNPGHQLIEASLVRAPLEVSRPLFLGPGAEVVVLSRLRLLDNIPAVIQTDWIPAARVPGLLDLDWSVTNRSLYEELRQRYQIFPKRGQTTLSARLATDNETDLLQLSPPAAVLTVDQIAFDDRNRPVNMTALAHHPLRYPLTLLQSETGDFTQY